MEFFKIAYEATGFTDDKELIGAELSKRDISKLRKTAEDSKDDQQEEAFPENVLDVVGGYVTDDDHQYESDIHIFVQVVLLVQAQSMSMAEKMVPPSEFLTRVSEMIVHRYSADVDNQSWEMVDVERCIDSKKAVFSRP